jgi:hypothetical protein
VQHIWQSSFITVCGKFFAIDEGVGEGEMGGTACTKPKSWRFHPRLCRNPNVHKEHAERDTSRATSKIYKRIYSDRQNQ